MGIRHILPALAAAALAALPAAALANLQVNANGFRRVVASSTHGPSCEVSRVAGGTSISCPDGAKGTMVLYQGENQAASCVLDFWSRPATANAPPWGAYVSSRQAASGTPGCSLNWTGTSTLDVAPPPSG